MMYTALNDEELLRILQHPNCADVPEFRQLIEAVAIRFEVHLTKNKEALSDLEKQIQEIQNNFDSLDTSIQEHFN